jgi:antibiotic biosynthesis monooxygenase (ABM) superfamily enzyme
MVLGLSWVVIPTLTRIFASWLAPTPPAARRRLARRFEGPAWGTRTQ